MSYEETKIREMLKLARFSGNKKDILGLLRSAKKDKTSPGGAIVGIYISMKEQLDGKELKIIFPDLF